MFTSVTVRATQEQVALAEQGQITDRYARAVEQIGQQGADHLQVRLGGIYALERITHDSPRDQPTIVEVLAAFIRTTVYQIDADGVCPMIIGTLPADIEAAFTVLGRRDPAHDGTAQTDFHGICLTGADLTGAHLAFAHLAAAHLNSAALSGVDLRGADLRRADLAGAHLAGARLAGAKLLGADLTDAQLAGADLRGADLTEADLRHADLTDAVLSGAVLTDTHHDDHTNVVAARTDSHTSGAWW